jgi:hypothetical protein
MVRAGRIFLSVFSMVSLAALAACSNDNKGDDDAPVVDAAPTVDVSEPPGEIDAGGIVINDAGPPSDAWVTPENSYSLTWGPVTAQPGDEHTQCLTLELGNAEAFHVNQIHNALTGGSHHLIVYRVAADEAVGTVPQECTPFAGTLEAEKSSPLMITQRHDEVLGLPTGVGFSLEAHQKIRLEMHFINASDEPIDISSVTTFVPMDPADFVDEADFLFIGNPDIKIPAGQAKTIGPVYLPMPAEFNGSKFFALTGHTHQYGVNVQVAAAFDDLDEGDLVYDHENFKWNEPITSFFNPTFSLPDNGGFRFSCDYVNTSNKTVEFGESANDEMCFFWAYYYPSKGARICVHTDRLGTPVDACCPSDDEWCPLIDQFLHNL